MIVDVPGIQSNTILASAHRPDQAIGLQGVEVILALAVPAQCETTGELRDELDRKCVLELLRGALDGPRQLDAGARAALSAVKCLAGAAKVRKGVYGAGSYAGKVRRRGSSSAAPTRKKLKLQLKMVKPPAAHETGATIQYGAATLFVDRLHRFWRNAAERQRIFGLWRQGSDGPPRSTWTSDPVFARVKICNVFRFQDRATAWLLARVLGPLAQHNRPGDVLFNAMIFRSYLTWEKSMAAMCGAAENSAPQQAGEDPCAHGISATGFSVEQFESRLYATLAQFGKLNQRPYLVRPIAKRRGKHTHLGIAVGPDPPEEIKPHRYAAFFGFLATRVEALMLELLSAENNCNTVRESSSRTFDRVLALMKEWTGEAWPFVTYQICVDIGYVYPRLFDESEWVFVGATGASSGLAWLFAERRGMSDEACVRLLETHQEHMMDQAGVDAATRLCLFGDVPRSPSASPRPGLNLMALEGWLCETNK